MADNQIFDTISSIYDAALNDDHWESVLQKTLSLLGRNTGSIQFMDLETSAYTPLAFTGFDKAFFEDPLDAMVVEDDLWTQTALANPNLDVLVGSEFVEEREFKSTSFYNEFMPVYDLQFNDILSGFSTDFPSHMGIAAIYSKEKQDPFTKQEIEYYRLLWPHFKRAFLIRSAMSELSTQRSLTTHFADTLDYGVVGLDGDDSVVFANSRAIDFLSDGEPIAQVNGKLKARRTSDNSGLQMALSRVRNRHAPGKSNISSSVTIVSKDESKSWTILFSPLLPLDTPFAGLNANRSIKTLLKITDHQLGAELRIQTLVGPYRLTPAEANLMASLMSGWTLNGVAEQTGRSVETLRSHLKSIFLKTNTNSQQELARFIMSTPG